MAPAYAPLGSDGERVGDRRSPYPRRRRPMSGRSGGRIDDGRRGRPAFGAPRFDVVLRGYDRRQVDEHISRLQRLMGRMRSDLDVAQCQQAAAARPAPGRAGSGHARPRAPAPTGPPPTATTSSARSPTACRASCRPPRRRPRRSGARPRPPGPRRTVRAVTAATHGGGDGPHHAVGPDPQRDAVLTELTRVRGQLEGCCRPDHAVPASADPRAPAGPADDAAPVAAAGHGRADVDRGGFDRAGRPVSGAPRAGWQRRTPGSPGTGKGRPAPDRRVRRWTASARCRPREASRGPLARPPADVPIAERTASAASPARRTAGRDAPGARRRGDRNVGRRGHPRRRRAAAEDPTPAVPEGDSPGDDGSLRRPAAERSVGVALTQNPVGRAQPAIRLSCADAWGHRGARRARARPRRRDRRAPRRRAASTAPPRARSRCAPAPRSPSPTT